MQSSIQVYRLRKQGETRPQEFEPDTPQPCTGERTNSIMGLYAAVYGFLLSFTEGCKCIWPDLLSWKASQQIKWNLWRMEREIKREIKNVSKEDRKLLRHWKYTVVAGFLSLCTSAGTAQSIAGDLQERYVARFKNKGSNASGLWFWREVIHSFFSLAFDALKRVSGLERLFRRIGS